jgi:hypothetical protein
MQVLCFLVSDLLTKLFKENEPKGAGAGEHRMTPNVTRT